MSGNTPQLVLPQGCALELGAEGVTVRHTGDIVVSGPQGTPLARLFSVDGSITLKGPLELGEVHADHGSIFIEGRVTARSIVALGGNIVVQGALTAVEVAAPAGSVSLAGELNVERISAAADLDIEGRIQSTLVKGGMVRLRTEEAEVKAMQGMVSVELGGGSYAAEIVIAPQVSIDHQAGGRINVLECANDPGTNDLKGKFRLVEYGEFTGVDPAQFLADRDVLPLDQLGAAAAMIPEEPEALEPEFLEPVADEPAAEEPAAEPVPESRRRARQLEVIEFPGVDSLLEQIAVADASEGDTAALPDIAELGDDALESIEDHDSTTTIIDDEDTDDDDTDEGNSIDPALLARLGAAVDELGGAYPSTPPEPVGRVLQLGAVRDFAQMRAELPELFNELLAGHVATRSQPQRQVLRSINELHAALQQI
jgi:hypothetical protein